MAENIDTKIEEAQRRLDESVAKMKDFLISRTVDFLSDWYMSEIEQQVKRDPTNTKSIGKPALREIKEKVAALQNQSVDIAAEFLADESIWWHESFGDQDYSYFGNRPPSPFDKLIRLACGKIATILEDYGYLQGDRLGYGIWREWNRGGN